MESTQQIPTILIVDDQPANLQILLSFLQKEGFRILVADSGERALQHLTRQQPDLILLDVMMPGLDGFEVCRRIKSDPEHADIPILFLTALTDIEDKIQGFLSGGADYITKPFQQLEVLARINTHLTVHRQQQEIKRKNLKLEALLAEQELSRRELEKEKELLAVTLRSIGDGVIATDLEGKVFLFNRVAEQLTGWSKDEATGRTLSEVFCIINEKTRKPCENPVQRVLETGHIIGLANHTLLIARDGTERSIADSAAPIRDRESRIIGTVLVFRDVTLENKITAELTRSKRLESIGVLAGGIAHDFNNLLTGILGNLSLAKLQLQDDEPLRDLLEMATNAAERANRLTKQLLTFAKGGAPVKENASIYEIIRESCDFVLSGTNVNCRIDRATELWNAEVDRGQISQVIQNLALNARQAMPEGGDLHIECVNYRHTPSTDNHLPLAEGDYIKIRFQDEGVGIPAKVVDKIFEPYFTTKQQGSGLGLAVTHSIIRKHGGHIECERTGPQGTVFAIYLPAAAGSSTEEKDSPDGSIGQGRILLMDDEEVIRDVAEKMLTYLGYDLVLTCEGKETIACYRRAMETGDPFRAVILDLTIPGGMGGAETAKQLLEIDPDAVLLVSSGYSNDPIMAEYRKHGFLGVLHKPYLLENMQKTLSRVLGDRA